MEKKILTVFFGTHEFAASIFSALLETSFIKLKLVITQPDKAQGRNHKIIFSPVKQLAIEKGIKVAQPESLKNFDLTSLLKKEELELGITAQYGKLVPLDMIQAFKHQIINVHPSLLPKYRGPTPIQAALLSNDKETGTTIMLMDKGMDTGPILAQKTIEILPDDTYTTLGQNLAKISSQALIQAIPGYTSGKLEPISQENHLATICPLLSRDSGRINWSNTTQQIYNQYRALIPWPGIWTSLHKQRIKLLHILPAFGQKIGCGKILIKNDKIYIGTQDGAIEVSKLQIEGKSPVLANAFLTGHANLDNESVV